MTKYILKDYNYDSDHDVLYCHFSDTNNSYGDEHVDNIVFLRDFDTDALTGITVLDFLKMCRLHDSRVFVVSEYLDVSKMLKQISANNYSG